MGMHGKAGSAAEKEERQQCEECGLPTKVDDYGLCNRCHDELDGKEFHDFRDSDMPKKTYQDLTTFGSILKEGQ